MKTTTYDLSRLFADQDPVFVEESLPALLSWVQGRGTRRRESPFEFQVATSPRAHPARQLLELAFDPAVLETRLPGLTALVERWRAGRTLHIERHAELAALGLSLAAISAWLPGKRVLAQNRYAPPDLLFDVTPGALRGVEAAGRSSGGPSALADVAEDKRPRVRRSDVAEAWLSLWCSRPRVALWIKAK